MPETTPGSPRSGRKRVTVERVGPRHRELVTEFFRREWGGDRPLAEGAERRTPDPSVPQWVCLRGDEAIGYLGTIPTTLYMAGAPVAAHWLKGFWVTEQYRGGPVGHLLVEQALEELGVVGSQVVAPAARRVLEALGLTLRCRLFDRVLPLRAGRIVGWRSG